MHISRLLALSSLVAASIATYFDGRIVAHDGEPIGYEEEHNGSMSSCSHGLDCAPILAPSQTTDPEFQSQYVYLEA